jgi:hypothetical protein
MAAPARTITSSKSHPAIRNTNEVCREEDAERVGDKLMRSLIVWSLGPVAQTVRMQSLVRNQKKALPQDRKIEGALRLLPSIHGICRAGSGAVENEFHFQDARMVF